MYKIVTARFETGKRGLIASVGCVGDHGPWIVPGDRCAHVLTPKEGVEYSVEIVGQSKQGNLRFGRIVSTAALVKSVEREVQATLQTQGLDSETIPFRRGTICVEKREDYDYRSYDGRPQDSWNFAARVTARAELSEFPGSYVEVLARNVPLLGEEGLARKREAEHREREDRETADQCAKEEFWVQLPEWAREFVYEPESAYRHFDRETEFPESIEWCGGESHRLYSESRWCRHLVVLLQSGTTRVYRKVLHDDDLIVIERTEEPDDDEEDNEGGQFCSGHVNIRFRDATQVQGLFWASGEEVYSYSDSDTSYENHLWLRE